MKKCIMLIALCTLAYCGMSQSAVAAGGGITVSNGGGSISDCIGQVMTTYAVGTDCTVAAGVEQVYEITTEGIDDYPTISLTAKVYPNPTVGMLTLSVDEPGFDGGLTADVVNITGQTVMSTSVDTQTTSIDMSKLAEGVYFLRVKKENNNLKTFKIVKR